MICLEVKTTFFFQSCVMGSVFLLLNDKIEILKFGFVLSRYATESEKALLRRWALEDDMDFLEKNLAVLTRTIEDRLESRGFLEKLFDVKTLKVIFDVKTLKDIFDGKTTSKKKLRPQQTMFKRPIKDKSEQVDQHIYNKIHVGQKSKERYRQYAFDDAETASLGSVEGNLSRVDPDKTEQILSSHRSNDFQNGRSSIPPTGSSLHFDYSRSDDDDDCDVDDDDVWSEVEEIYSNIFGLQTSKNQLESERSTFISEKDENSQAEDNYKSKAEKEIANVKELGKSKTAFVPCRSENKDISGKQVNPHFNKFETNSENFKIDFFSFRNISEDSVQIPVQTPVHSNLNSTSDEESSSESDCFYSQDSSSNIYEEVTFKV